MRRVNRFDVGEMVCLTIAMTVMLRYGVPLWATVIVAVVFALARVFRQAAIMERRTLDTLDEIDRFDARKRAGFER